MLEQSPDPMCGFNDATAQLCHYTLLDDHLSRNWWWFHKRERLTMVEGLISQAKIEAAKLARALVDASDVVGDILKRQIDNLNGRHAALCTERDTLTAEIEAGALSDEQIAAMLTTFSEYVITGLQNATFEEEGNQGPASAGVH